MRKVKFQYWNEGILSDWVNGYFHLWGLESCESVDGNIMDTIAIIEDANGHLYTVTPKRVIFIDKINPSLKSFQGLGMNINSDKFILPDSYTPIEQPYYSGDGNHSVSELQKLCRDFSEYCHQQAIIKSELIKEIKSF